MSVLCKVFGHKMPDGWQDLPPILNLEIVYSDRGNRKYAVRYKCKRCKEEQTLGFVFTGRRIRAGG